MANIQTVVNWFNDRKGRVTYSMTHRNGPSSYDCSSAEYYSLIQAGYFPVGTWIGNTDSLYNDLEKNGWTKVPVDANGDAEVQAGDVFLWGKRGASTGAFGHTGTFMTPTRIIHCSYGYNGIHEDNHDWLWVLNGQPEYTFYRFTGNTYVAPSIQGSPTDQLLDIGSTIKFTETYTVDDLQEVGGVWQVRTDRLCPDGFTWDENGIPVEQLVEVDDDGFKTSDQELDVGSKYKLPGKFEVQDLGEVNGVWLALIESDGMKFWVDVASATEIATTDSGTPQPLLRTIEPVTTPEPTEATKPAEVITDQPIETTAPKEPTIPSKTNDTPKEDTMAFSSNDQKELLIATQKVQDLADSVAKDPGVQEITSSIDKRVKVAVYIIGDLLIGVGLVIPNLALAFNTGSLVEVTALSSVFATAGAFLLTMFSIYKNGN